MAGKWREVVFSEAVQVNPGVKLIRGESYPFVDMASVNANSRCTFVSEIRPFESGGSRFESGDTIMARITPCLENGKIARFCGNPNQKAHGSTEFIVIRGRDYFTDTAYSYYLTKWEGVSGYAISQMSGTSGRQRVPTSAFNHLVVPIPPLPEQRAIAHILGTLDDKIELNRKMNETLEAMARALFKSWFVDFDPVRAKAAGRDTGLPKHIADLFPDSFVDSELGEIPKGWDVLSLDEIAYFLNGLALQKFPPTCNRWLPVIKISQLRAGNTQGADRASADLETDYIVANGDILFSWSGSLECVLWAGGLGALNQHLFKVTSARYPKWLCYLGIHEHLDDFRHIAAGKATTMGHIQRHNLSDAKISVPSPKLVGEMDSILGPIIESIWQRKMQSKTLTVLRDTLLPRLISGELKLTKIIKYQEN